jgi:hypothetical protein
MSDLASLVVFALDRGRLAPDDRNGDRCVSIVRCKRRAIAAMTGIREIACFLCKSADQQTGRSSASDEKIDNNINMDC